MRIEFPMSEVNELFLFYSVLLYSHQYLSIFPCCPRLWRGVQVMMMMTGRTGEKNPEPRKLLGGL